MANITLIGADYEGVGSVSFPETGTSSEVTYYETESITYNLGDAISSVTTDKVVTGEGFATKITAPTGCSIQSITVTMDGVDITDSVVEYETESGSASADTYSVTYSLGNATANIDTDQVVSNEGFSVKIKAQTGYEIESVTVTMGGEDITSTAFQYDSVDFSSWLPPSAELVAEAEETINLSSDTSYDSWTPTTTNTSILSAGSARAACSYTITTDYADTALIGICLMQTNIAYPDGTTYAKGYSLQKTIMSVAHYAPMKDPAYANDYYGRAVAMAAYSQKYYSSASATTLYTGSSYSIGATSVTWSTSSTTNSSKRIVGFTRPAIYARCHSTYFSTTAASAVDSANSNIICKYKIYKIDKTESPLYTVFDETNGLLFN